MNDYFNLPITAATQFKNEFYSPDGAQLKRDIQEVKDRLNELKIKMRNNNIVINDFTINRLKVLCNLKPYDYSSFCVLKEYGENLEELLEVWEQLETSLINIGEVYQKAIDLGHVE